MSDERREERAPRLPRDPIPIVPPAREKFSEEPIRGPKQTVERLARRKGIRLDGVDLPESILLSLSAGVTQRLVDQTSAKQVDWIYGARPFYVGSFEGARVGIIWAAPSAPLATMLMEDLVACGSRLFVGVGLIAAIQPKVRPGDLVIPASSVRDEGTSYHYLPMEVPAAADPELVESLAQKSRSRGIAPHLGQIWTTDAPYRETPSKVRYFAHRGIIGTDMETSAIFSLALYRKVRAACLLVVSANLSEKGDDIGFYDEKLDEPVDNAIGISLEVVSEHSRK